jgi:hypothetical protein
MASMSPRSATLFINDKQVGAVKVKSLADSWGFGEFVPNAAFGEFATLFGNWSLLMHADDGDKKLSEAASEELRRLEYQLDSLHASLFLDSVAEWLDLAQVNIDGPLIEWKVMARRARVRD